MKKIIIGAFLLSSTLFSFSQIQPLGIVTGKINGANIGDTISLYHLKKAISSTGIDKYYVITSSLGEYVKGNKIRLLDEELNFWEKTWFANCSERIYKYGWQLERRDALNEDAFNYFKEAHANDIVYSDEFLYDYITQLLLKIHPGAFEKPNKEGVKLLIIKSQEQEYFAFDNGLVILTTGLIANTNGEEDLLMVLTECVSHIVFEHNLVNLNLMLRAERNAQIWGAVATVASSALMVSSNINNGTNFNFNDAALIGLGTYFVSGDIMESMGANYSNVQLENAKNMANKYLTESKWNYISEKDYLARIAKVINYSAQQSMFLMDYFTGLNLINRLYDNNLCNESDLLLKSKFTRLISTSTESNTEALQYINEAKKIGLTNIAELDKEEALIQLRLNNVEQARLAFDKYLSSLHKMKSEGVSVDDELRNINELIFRYNL